MHGRPIQTQRFSGGFSGSRFQSMDPQDRMGMVVRPAAIPIGPVVAPASYVYPPSVIAPPGVFVVPEAPSADDNKVVGIIVALAILGLGAALL